MRFIKQGDFYVIKLLKGERIVEQLVRFCKDNNIAAAAFTGIGAIHELEAGFYDAETKSYEWKKAQAQLELLNITGNISLNDREPFVHAHVTVADNELHAFGGHLKEATVSATCEIILKPIPVQMVRKHDSDTGLLLLDI